MADSDSVPTVKRPELKLVGDTKVSAKPTKKAGTGKSRKGHYFYPKALLRQPYFCLGGTGIWHEPDLSLAMVSNPKFQSPLKALLDQLEQEGHDVTGARIELTTYQEQSAKLCEDFQRIGWDFGNQFASLGRTHSILAKAIYSNPTIGGPAPDA